MTYNEVFKAWELFEKEKFPTKLYAKFEKYKSGDLYGIKVAGGEVHGTRVQGVGGKEGEGVVSSVSTENGDASVYTIRWSDVVPKARTRYSKFLKRCSRSRRVVAPEADKRQEGISREGAESFEKSFFSCSLGDTTASFNADGVCFKAKTDEHGEETNCKGLRDLF